MPADDDQRCYTASILGLLHHLSSLILGTGLMAYGDESPSDSEEPSVSSALGGKIVLRPDVRAFTANSTFPVSLLCSRSFLVSARINRQDSFLTRLQDVRSPFLAYRIHILTSRALLVSAGMTKPPVVIRRPVHAKPHPRARITEDEEQAPSTSASSSTAVPVAPDQDTGLPTDELTRIRALLRPPPIPGVEDRGIPREPTGRCDPDVEVRGLIT